MKELDNHTDNSNLCFHVVAIGASAGGLTPLETFFSNMPNDSGMAFVVIQHLSPNFKSHMKQLLEKRTDMPIHRVDDGAKVEANNIYLIPPKKIMVINNGHLLLTDKDSETHLSFPIDEFFRSLANDLGKQSIGIIFSGTGADGSKGIIKIAEVGGLVLAQDEHSAEFDSMPLNAMATGAPTLALPPEAMPEILVNYVNEALTPELLGEQHAEPVKAELVKVFKLLKQHYDIDFSSYKLSTIGRRIRRRALLTNQQNTQDYVNQLEENREELDFLYQDLLIGVTRFFRDKEMFQLLETQIAPAMIAKLKNNQNIRIWVTACATGQEAYSIAMIFHEQLEAVGKADALKIFATDIHQPSIKFAGIGRYDESEVSSIPQKYRDKYLTKGSKGYSINYRLRRSISFAKHNLITDAPFTKMDFISCRNLLIYLQPKLQKKLISLFHFGLQTGGTLLLGSSETLGELRDEFEEINARFRLYTKKRDVRLSANSRFNLNSTALLPVINSKTTNASNSPNASERSLLSIYDRLLDQFMPPSYLLDNKFHIVHIFGGGEKYLQLKSGRASAHFLDLIADDVKSSFSSAINHAVQKDTVVNYAGIRMQDAEGKMCSHQVSVQPIKEQRYKNSYLFIKLTEQEVNFSDNPGETIDLDMVTREHIQTLENELRYTQENLQATIEELETANEEMQASNEELVASNEELQSTNEELQSVNEELYTVNNEYQGKIAELEQANNDMDNLLVSTRVGVIFLDKDLRIRRYTPEIARLLQLLPQDIGRSIESFIHTINYPQLIEKLEEILESGSEFETETTDKKGNPFILRILPYRKTKNGKSYGLLITLIDIKLLKKAQGEVTQFKLISDHVSDCHLIVNKRGKILYVNRSALQSSEYQQQEIEQLVISDIFSELNHERLMELFTQLNHSDIKPYHSHLVRKDGSMLDVELMLVLKEFNSKEKTLFISARDISERIQNQRQLQLITRALEKSDNGVIITNCTANEEIVYVNQGFSNITGYKSKEVIGKKCSFLQGEKTNKEDVNKIRVAIKQGKAIGVQLLNYRKDGQSFWNYLQLSPIRDDSGTLVNYIGVVTDISKTVELEQLALEDSRKIKLLLNSTAEGIYFINLEGICTFCNSSAARLLGYQSPEDLIGQHMHKLIRHSKANGEKFPAEECDIVNSMRSGKCFSTDKEVFWGKKGNRIPVEVWSHPIVEENGKISGSVVTFFDITLRKKDQEQMKTLQLAAENANKAKSLFLTNISHELRTPLTAIQGFTELLYSELDDSSLLDKVNRIERNALHLQDLLNDLLDLSQIDSGFLNIDNRNCNLLELLMDINAIALPKASQKALSMSFEILTKVPQNIKTDAKRCKQIIINLLNNAIKYTQEGGVKLTVQLIDDPGQPLLEIAVTDTGIGIEQKNREHLFEPFFRAGDSKTQSIAGSGLGLSISVKLARQLGGEIDYDTTPGIGSQFRLYLPVEKNLDNPQLKPGPLENVDSEHESIRKNLPNLNCHVFIVDDHHDIKEYLQSLLQQAYCKVTLFDNGADIVNCLRDHKSEIKENNSIILMDINMPGTDGKQATAKIREMGFTLPIIGVSASAMKGEREKCLAVGFDDYVSKPINQLKLLKKIDLNLKKYQRDKPKTSSPPSSDSLKKILLVDDNKDITSAFKALLSSQGYHVNTLNSGKKVLKKLETFKPDITIMDISLADANGIELMETIKKQAAKNSKIASGKFIAITGHVDETTKQAALSAGFDDYLVKPITLETIKQAIE